MHKTRKTGDRGEALARRYLLKKGYSIVDQNWSTRFGEIDIVAQKRGIIVFVEVKTRHSSDTDSAFAAITPNKHDRLIKAVYQYLHDKGLGDDTIWRIDAIGIALGRHHPPIIEHIEDAFDW